MSKKIIFKEKHIERPHLQDERIRIKEMIVELVKTIGFNHISKEQEGYGYIRSQYVISHEQSWKDETLDSWADKDIKDDYEKRKEDFKKLMKNIDVSDDEIVGPYSRDRNGKKLIGDVVEHSYREKETEAFLHLCKVADNRGWLIEIEYIQDKS
jgi:hypothetical protein